MRFNFGVLVSAFLLASCATGSTIVTGTQHPAIAPEQVRLYSEAPAQFEVVGIISATSQAGLTTQDKMNAVLAELRRRAASLGANGILIEQTGHREELYAGGGANGMPIFAGSERQEEVRGRAIYVPPAPQ